MGKEEQLISISIVDSLHRAGGLVTKITHILHGLSSSDVERENPELDEANDMLSWYIEKLYRDIGILAERMHLPLLASSIATEFAMIKSDLARVEVTPYDIHLASPHLERVRAVFHSIAVMTQGTEATGLDVFRTILENTPAIINLTGADPKKESDVQREVFKVLKIAFPDAVREPSISQVFKSYKPDFGVRSLMAAAEYKFAETKDEVRHALDGIYTDMKGYSGHYDWRTFYAVIYTTDTVVNPKEVAAEFQGVKADTNWSPIVVVGKGKRKPKSANNKIRPKAPR